MNEDQPPSTNSDSQQSSSSNWLTRFKKRFRSRPASREELVRLLHDANQDKLIDDEALLMLEGVIRVSETQVRDIMIPRPHMVVLERDATMKEMIEVVVESGHSRFPVIGEDRDEVVGIILAKDLLSLIAHEDQSEFSVKEYLRPAVFIPESKRLNVLLKEFRASHNHMAIVVDEYGGIAGLITIEDVLEQIVGDIDDEHDIEADSDIVEVKPGVFAVRALTRIEDFNEHFVCQIDNNEYDTIGGMIMFQMGRLPRRGESLSVDGFEFKVLRTARRRIDLLQVQPQLET